MMVKDVMTLHILFLQKHVKDLTTKLHKRYLHRFGIKLLTKMAKNGICPIDGGKICINHVTFNANLIATHVHCILSQEAHSNHEDTTKDINRSDRRSESVSLNID